MKVYIVFILSVCICHTSAIYSQLTVNCTSTVDFVYVNNVCFRHQFKSLFEIPLYYANNNISNYRYCKSPFSCLNNYVLPQNENITVFNLEDPIYLIKFVTSLHLGHTFNNLMYLWYIIDNPNIFPIPKRIIFVDYSVNNDYNVFFMNFFVSKLREINPNIKIYYRDYIAKLIRREGVFCFSKAYVNQEVHVGGFGGFFITRKSHERFKDSVFDFIKFNKTEVLSIINKDPKIRILIVRRYDRNLINFDEIVSVIVKICEKMNRLFYIDMVTYEDLSAVYQVTLSFGFDIYISPHGTSLFNILWLNNNKCVIELFPSFFIRPDWMYSSYDYGLYYYPVFSSYAYNWEYLSMYHRGKSPSMVYKLKASLVPNYREDFYISSKQIMQSFLYCYNRIVNN